MRLLIGADAIAQFGRPHMIGYFVAHPLHYLLGTHPRLIEQGARVRVDMAVQFGILGFEIAHLGEGTLENAAGKAELGSETMLNRCEHGEMFWSAVTCDRRF